MKIIKERPPIYDAICSIIGKPPDTAIFAYGDTIYNPSGADIPDDIIKHEEVHEKQQGEDPLDWWKKYLRDEDFRLDQELEAYGVQYRYIHNTIKDREVRRKYLFSFAHILSSEMYGGIVDFDRARQLIHDKANV